MVLLRRPVQLPGGAALTRIIARLPDRRHRALARRARARAPAPPAGALLDALAGHLPGADRARRRARPARPHLVGAGHRLPAERALHRRVRLRAARAAQLLDRRLAPQRADVAAGPAARDARGAVAPHRRAARPRAEIAGRGHAARCRMLAEIRARLARRSFDYQWGSLPTGDWLSDDPRFGAQVERIISEEELAIDPEWFRGRRCSTRVAATAAGRMDSCGSAATSR